MTRKVDNRVLFRRAIVPPQLVAHPMLDDTPDRSNDMKRTADIAVKESALKDLVRDEIRELMEIEKVNQSVTQFLRMWLQDRGLYVYQDNRKLWRVAYYGLGKKDSGITHRIQEDFPCIEAALAYALKLLPRGRFDMSGDKPQWVSE